MMKKTVLASAVAMSLSFAMSAQAAPQAPKPGGVQVSGTVNQNVTINGKVDNKQGDLRVGAITGKTKVGGRLDQTVNVKGDIKLEGSNGFLGLGSAKPQLNIGRINNAEVDGAVNQNVQVDGKVTAKSTSGFLGIGGKSGVTNIGNISDVDVSGRLNQHVLTKKDVLNEGGNLDIGSIEDAKVTGDLNQHTHVFGKVTNKSSNGFRGLGGRAATNRIGHSGGVDVSGKLNQNTNVYKDVLNEGGTLEIGSIEDARVKGNLTQNTTVRGKVTNKAGGGFLGLGQSGGTTQIGKINGVDVGTLNQNVTINKDVVTEGGTTQIGYIGR